MGIWNSLTLQGKVAIAAAVLGGLFILSLAYGSDGSGSGGDDDNPGFASAPTQSRATITPTFRVEFPTPIGTPPPASPVPPVLTEAPPTQGPAATATRPANTPTRAPTIAPTAIVEELPPEELLPPPPPPPTQPPPTATASSGCRVAATVSGGNTVTGTMTCAGSAVGAGAPMTATFNFANLSSGCSAIGNASGTATCTARLTGEPGALSSVDVCMTAQSGRVCTTTQ